MISIELQYNRLNASLNAFVESVEYVDYSGTRPSTLSVILNNADGRFTREWACTRGDSLGLKFGAARTEALSISSVTVQAMPRTVTWTASAIPATTSAPSGRGKGEAPPAGGALVADSKSWTPELQNVRLSAVAQRVCSECGLTLRYLAKNDPVIPIVSRCMETGYHLLARISRRYALSVRATASEVQIVPRPATRSGGGAQSSVALPLSAIVALGSSESMAPAKVASARFDPRKGEAVRSSYGDGEGAIGDLVFDADDAGALYSDAVLDSMAAQIDVTPNEKYVAGAILQIPGYGLRVITEMRYTRTGDTESMILQTRGAR